MAEVRGTGPRILLVLNGVSKFFTHRAGLASGLQRRGYRVEVVTPASEDGRRVRRAGFVSHQVPLERSSRSPVTESKTVLALKRLYRRRRPQIVHHFTPKPVIYGGIAARLAGLRRVVASIAGLEYPYIGESLEARTLRLLAEMGYRAALDGIGARVIFENAGDRDEFVERGLADRERSTVIVGAGVDTEKFRPSPPPRGTVTVTLASRMLEQKGVVEFVEAARRLARDGTDARYVLVGDSDPTNPTSIPRDRLREWDASGPVVWWGPRSHDEMPDLLRRSHVVCLPSYREGAPKVLLEAAASGRPVVTTDVPGCREAVVPGESGLLVPAADAAGLAAALGRLIPDAGLRKRMGRRARELALEEFSLERVVERTVSVYRDLLREPAAA